MIFIYFLLLVYILLCEDILFYKGAQIQMCSMKLKSLILAVSSIFSFQSSAYEWTMDFQQFVNTSGNTVDLTAGRIIDAEYTQSTSVIDNSGMVVDTGISTSVRVDNFNNNYINGVNDADLAVIYNTSQAANQAVNGITQKDPDLDASFTHFETGQVYSPNNILVLQNEDDWDTCKRGIGDSNTGSKAGFCTTVNDEADRPSGQVSFIFSDLVSLASINFFDIDTTDEGPQTFVTTYDENGDEVETQHVTGFGIGSASDNKWGTISFANSDTIQRIVVTLGGSGGFSDIKLANVIDDITEVAEPQIILLMLMGIGMIVIGKRRNSLKLSQLK